MKCVEILHFDFIEGHYVQPVNSIILKHTFQVYMAYIVHLTHQCESEPNRFCAQYNIFKNHCKYRLLRVSEHLILQYSNHCRKFHMDYANYNRGVIIRSDKIQWQPEVYLLCFLFNVSRPGYR